MKKTIIALATAAVLATSANAATVFEKEGSKVEVNGTFGVFLVKAKEQRTDLTNDDSHLAFSVSHKLSDNVTALGYSKITFDNEEDASFGSPKLDKIYAGFDVKTVGKFTFGKQATNGDDVQLNDNAYIFGGNNNLTTDADKSFKFRSADMNGFSFGLDYIFGESTKVTEDSDLKYGYQASLFYSRALANGFAFDLAAGYGVNRYTEELSTKIASRENTWRAAAKVSYGPVTFGAEYGAANERFVDESNIKSNHILVSASYQVSEPSKIYVQWKRDLEKSKLGYIPAFEDEDGDIFVGNDVEKVKSQSIIVGVDYKFHKNVVTYLEYARVTTKEEAFISELPSAKVKSTAKENAFGVGLRVLF